MTTFRDSLALIVVLGSLALLGVLVVVPVPADNKDILNIGLGLVLGWGTAIVGFYWGSSQTKRTQAVTVENTPDAPVPVEAAP